MISRATSDSCGLVPLPIPVIQAGLILSSPSSHYLVLEICGKGRFGKVGRCKNLATEEIVAVKMIKTKCHSKREVSMLEAISVLDGDKNNMVKFYGQFQHQGLNCLVFEMLDRNLYDLLPKLDGPLLLDSIRPIARQLLVALDALRLVGILHADIKLENIMFVNVHDQPLRVKLIDFGNALPVAGVHPGMVIQPLAYRAPEIVLGLPFNEAIDVWGVGCVLATLYLGRQLFPYSSEYELMKAIADLLGQPQDHQLLAGLYTRNYFVQKKTATGLAWRLMTQEEHMQNNNTGLPSSLDFLVHIYYNEEEAEFQDSLVFVDLLKQLLCVDPDHRISALEALWHPFITMEHLTQIPDSETYLAISQACMSEPWKCDADVPPVSQPNPDICSPDGTHDADIPGEEAAAEPSDEDVDRWSNDGDLAARSSEGAEHPGFAPDVSASTGRQRKFLTRIQQIWKCITTLLSCCRRVED